MGSPAPWRKDRSVLVVVAAPAEARAVAAGLKCAEPTAQWTSVDAGSGWRLLRSGVGKVNAALAVTREIASAQRPPIVLNLGVCGSLPVDGEGPPLRSVAVGSEAVYADEGAITPSGFVDMGAMGFPLWEGAPKTGCAAVASDTEIRERCIAALRAGLRDDLRVGRIATVSTCSGTDASARECAARTGAIVEAMEGAAIAHAMRLVAGGTSAFLEIRVVSNTTGDRTRQMWDLPGSLEVLTRVASVLRSA